MSPEQTESQPPIWSGAIIPHQATPKQRVLARLIYAVAWLLSSTLRYRWERIPQELPQEGRPYIFCVWHNRLPLSLVMYRQFVKSAGAPFRMAALVSASRDGAMMTRVLELFGVEPARGSSSRRGTQALLELAEWTARGYDVAFAPDGPRGPAYAMKPGIVALAQMTGRPIVPATYRLTRKVTLKSWDRFQIPLPFSKCIFNFADPVRVPRQFRDEEREKVRARLEAELRRLTVD